MGWLHRNIIENAPLTVSYWWGRLVYSTVSQLLIIVERIHKWVTNSEMVHQFKMVNNFKIDSKARIKRNNRANVFSGRWVTSGHLLFFCWPQTGHLVTEKGILVATVVSADGCEMCKVCKINPNHVFDFPSTLIDDQSTSSIPINDSFTDNESVLWILINISLTEALPSQAKIWYPTYLDLVETKNIRKLSKWIRFKMGLFAKMKNEKK